MGIAQNLGWTDVHNWVDPRRNMLLGASAGFLSGNLGNAPLYAMQGKQVDDANATRAKEEADRVAQINQTAQWARGQFPELANAPDELVAQVAPSLWQKQLMGGVSELPANIREWEYFSKLPPEQQTQYLTMKRSNPYLDVGTGFVQPNPIAPGTANGPEIVKDNFTPAYDAAAGTATAKVDIETQAAADSLASKMPGLKTVVGELSNLAQIATYTQTGQLIDNAMREAGLEPTEAAVARTKYIAMVDNQILPLLRDTFGAAFTAKEGDTLRATLGDPNKSPAEKQVILEAFIEQKIRDLEALQSRLPSSNGGPVDYKTKYGLE